MFSPHLQVVVLCFAVAFGSFFQGYGPYPSATKMALPSKHPLSEPYTASVGKSPLRYVCLQLVSQALCKGSHPMCESGVSIFAGGVFWEWPLDSLCNTRNSQEFHRELLEVPTAPHLFYDKQALTPLPRFEF